MVAGEMVGRGQAVTAAADDHHLVTIAQARRLAEHARLRVAARKDEPQQAMRHRKRGCMVVKYFAHG
jgi:hypothetical protein